jgi:hypothetical protein
MQKFIPGRSEERRRQIHDADTYPTATDLSRKVFRANDVCECGSLYWEHVTENPDGALCFEPEPGQRAQFFVPFGVIRTWN